MTPDERCYGDLLVRPECAGCEREGKGITRDQMSRLRFNSSLPPRTKLFPSNLDRLTYAVAEVIP